MNVVEWEEWCGEVEFKFVWLGLGIWQAMLEEGTAFPFPSEVGLEVALKSRFVTFQLRGTRIPWQYPTSAHILQAAPPSLWYKAMKSIGLPWRVVKIDGPDPGDQSSWRQPLLVPVGPDQVKIGATDQLAVTAPQLRLGWPMRIGYFENNKPLNALRGLLPDASGTGGRLFRQFALGRERAKCDVLVFWGTAAELVNLVNASNGRIKANLLMLITPDTPDKRGGAKICDLVRASGLVVLNSIIAGTDLDHALLSFITEFSHGECCDVALHISMQGQFRVSAILLREELAGTNLREIAGLLKQKFDALPDNATLRASAALEPALNRPGYSGVLLSGGPPEQFFNKSLVNLDLGSLAFLRESDGATLLADLADSLNDAKVPETINTNRANRFLQQQSFVLPDGYREPFASYFDSPRPRQRATHGFLVGKPAEVDLRIGPRQDDWQSMPHGFPDGDLFLERDAASLTVWLTEPDQLEAPVSGKLRLPRDGASVPCTLRFTPRQVGHFEGRITVLHRGRVLQTALLVAQVNDEESFAFNSNAPELRRITPVRYNLGDISSRRYYDLAIVENHTEADTPRTVALSPDRAWIADGSALIDHLREISESLTEVAKSTSDFAEGIGGEEGKRILIDLARSGSSLNNLLMREHLQRPGNNASVAKMEFIQIVSMRSETVPLEFAYEFPPPQENATLCAHWRQALNDGKCDASCGGGSRQRVCPMGFWGVSKVIERHQLSYEHRVDGKEYFLQSEPTRQAGAITVGGPVVFSGSARINADALEKVRAALEAAPGVEAVLVKTWEQWASEVSNRNPRLILSMPHTDGTNRDVSLEISQQTIMSIDLTQDHVCPQPDGRPPIVVLLGCEVAAPTSAFSRHVAAFNHNGAAVVLATFATVAASHAVEVAAVLATELLKRRTEPFRLGEAIRAVKRRSLLNNLIMPLCVVAYGDADWRIETNGVTHDDI